MFSLPSLQYRQLKKQIGRCEAELDALDEAQNPIGESTAVRTRSQPEPDLERGVEGAASHPAKDTTTPPVDGAPRYVVSPDASDFSHQTESEAPLRRRGSVASGMSTASAGLLKRMQLRRRASGLTPAGDFNPKKWRKPFSGGMSLAEIVDLCESLPAPHCVKYVTMLDRELDRVSKFYEDRESDAVKRFEELSMQWRELAGAQSDARRWLSDGADLCSLSQTTRRSSRCAKRSVPTLYDLLTDFDVVQAFRAREMNPPQFLAPVVARVPQLPGSNLVRRTLAARGRGNETPNSDAHSHEASDGNCYTHGRPEDYTAARSKLKLASESLSMEFVKSHADLMSYSVRVLPLPWHAQVVSRAQSNRSVFAARFSAARADR